MSFGDDCAREVVEMHEAIEIWLVAGADDALDRFERALAPEFVIVDPDGGRTERDELVEGFSRAGGSQAASTPPFEIEVREVETRITGEAFCLVTYEEWQRSDGDETGRISSALFQRADAPDGVAWVHLHETWLQPPG